MSPIPDTKPEGRPMTEADTWTIRWAGSLEYVEDFMRAWHATMRDPAGRASLTVAYQQAQRDGQERGGLRCCGTTSEWHRPWCRVGPRRHRAAQEDRDMAETITRIRWHHDGTEGFVGTVGSRVFALWPPEGDDGEWLLTAALTGMEGERRYGTPDELKAEAERWLERFVSSLGAVFPDEPGTMFADVTDGEAYEEAFRARHAPGRRVRFARPDAGYPADQEMAAGLLTPGEVYVIAWSDSGFSSSSLGLAGIESGPGFNSVLFEPVDDETPAPMAGEADATETDEVAASSAAGDKESDNA